MEDIQHAFQEAFSFFEKKINNIKNLDGKELTSQGVSVRTILADTEEEAILNKKAEDYILQKDVKVDKEVLGRALKIVIEDAIEG